MKLGLISEQTGDQYNAKCQLAAYGLNLWHMAHSRSMETTPSAPEILMVRVSCSP